MSREWQLPHPGASLSQRVTAVRKNQQPKHNRPVTEDEIDAEPNVSHLFQNFHTLSLSSTRPIPLGFFFFPSTINLKGLNHFLLRCTIRPPPPLEQIFQSFHHRICVHLNKCKRQSVFLQYVYKTLIFKPRIINKLDQAKHINKTFTCRTFTFSMPKIQLENLFSVWCWVRLLHS